jgi:hypothetical protein
MNRIVLTTTIGGDGNLRLNLPVGATEANKEVQVTVEPLSHAGSQTLRACDLLQSDLIGIWAERSDIGDSREFARRLRAQAQTRKSD